MSVDAAALKEILKPEDRSAFRITERERRYVVGLLLIVSILNFVDRQIMAVLLEAIKVEFSFTDTQLGLLGGLAFAVFHSIVGIPLASLADRINRRNIIAVTLCLWSGMTAVCGLATGFISLFLARVGVGVGEAGSSPASNSILADYYPADRRGIAMAVQGMGVPLGVLTGFLVGGWVNQFFGWRSAFMVVGLPGIAAAVLVRLTMREPPRGLYDAPQPRAQAPSLVTTLRYLWKKPACHHLLIASSLYGLSGWGAGIWQPSFFMRSHGMTSGEAGTWLAFVFGISGACGAFLGGAWGDHMFRKTQDPRWYMWISSLGIVVSLPVVFLVYLWPAPIPALLFLIVPTFLGHMYLGPSMSMLLGIAGSARRAVASAIYAFFVNLISMGIGPLAVGALSDSMQPRYGNDSLRYAILSVVVVATLWAAIHFLLAAKTLKEDLASDGI